MMTADCGIDNTLQWLICPTEPHLFLKNHWEQKPYRILRQDPGYYGSLLSEETLEYALLAASRVPGALEELAGGDRPRRCRNYNTAIEAYRQGKSLRIDAIQRFSREVAALCRSLEQEFSCPINTNMYLTPPGKQALNRHYDTHDVFVLQIHGKKRWRIFDSAVQIPLEYVPPLRCEAREKGRLFRLEKRKDVSSKDTCRPMDDFFLEAGDLLYLPRGFWHEAEAVSGHTSCHLTIGVQSFTYTDLLTVAITQLASAQPELRESLPFGFGTHADCRDVVHEQVGQILEMLPNAIDSTLALNEIAESFMRSRRLLPWELFHGSHAEANPVGLHSRFRIRDGGMCGVAVVGEKVTLNYHPVALTLPAAFEPAFRFIARNRPFSVREIPGEITDEERISLVERLVAEDLLLEVSDRPSSFQQGELASSSPCTPPKSSLRYLAGFRQCAAGRAVFCAIRSETKKKSSTSYTNNSGFSIVTDKPGRCTFRFYFSYFTLRFYLGFQHATHRAWHNCNFRSPTHRTGSGNEQMGNWNDVRRRMGNRESGSFTESHSSLWPGLQRQ
jgi:ribosomal protein L16 Arg81 hydroxylase